MRHLDEIAKPGAAWITESELEALIAVARAAQPHAEAQIPLPATSLRAALAPLLAHAPEGEA